MYGAGERRAISGLIFPVSHQTLQIYLTKLTLGIRA
jgi:hypothetical protein